MTYLESVHVCTLTQLYRCVPCTSTKCLSAWFLSSVGCLLSSGPILEGVWIQENPCGGLCQGIWDAYAPYKMDMVGGRRGQ